MANPLVKKITSGEAKDIFGRIALSNHYVVDFSLLNTGITNHITDKFGVPNVKNFISRKTGLLCSDASLPGSSLGTGQVKGNFMGVPQEFAHSRIYQDLDFSFYIDGDHTNLKVFEGWIDYIASGSKSNESNHNYYRRMRYPDDYKCDTMQITKFEKDMKSQITYKFINAFPKTITPISVSYGGAELLKVNVSFSFDRYIVGNYSNRKDATESSKSSSLAAPDKIAPSEASNNDRFLGPPTARGLNSQQTLNELYEAGRSGRIKNASDFIGPLQ